MNGVVYGREDERFRDTDKLTNTITAMNILKKCTFSTLQTNTVDAPFFNPDVDNKVTIDRMSMSTKDNAVITELANTLRFPPSFTRIYELLDSDEREFTFHNFTFFTINEMKRRRDIFKTKAQSIICDVATAYLGMGHVVVLSWSSENNVFFMRIDGGGNGYEREDYWNFIRTYDTSTIPIIKQISPVTLFNVLSRENVEDYNEFFINPLR